MSGVLNGIRILDTTIWQLGPTATMMLADLGAEVIKVEQRLIGDPGRGYKRLRGQSIELPDGRSAYFEHLNRNKKSIALDLTKEAGKMVLYRLVAKCDVFVQNFRPSVAKRLRLDYHTLSKYNPKLVYGSGSGFGLKGPDSGQRAFDALGQARSGIMTAAASEPGMPPVSIAGGIADAMGGVMLAYSVLAALVARERLGIGQEVDASHLGSMIWLQNLNVALVLSLGREVARHGRAKAFNPLYNSYQCSDGKWLQLGHLQPDRYWAPFCRALGIEELTDDPRFKNMDIRGEHSEELVTYLDRIFATQTREEWMKICRDANLIYSPVNTVEDLPNDPQVLANNYITDFDHPTLGKIKVVDIAVHLSKTPGVIRAPAPEYAQHTEEVLLEIGGYSWEEIATLKEQEVI